MIFVSHTRPVRTSLMKKRLDGAEDQATKADEQPNLADAAG